MGDPGQVQPSLDIWVRKPSTPEAGQTNDGGLLDTDGIYFETVKTGQEVPRYSDPFMTGFQNGRSAVPEKGRSALV